MIGNYFVTIFQATDTIAELESQATQLKQALQDSEFQRQRQLRVRACFESYLKNQSFCR